jgi:hypothetical protein
MCSLAATPSIYCENWPPASNPHGGEAEKGAPLMGGRGGVNAVSGDLELEYNPQFWVPEPPTTLLLGSLKHTWIFMFILVSP